AKRLDRPAEAAAQYALAIEYNLRQPNPPMVVVASRTREGYRAFLRAGQLQDAAAFAQKMMMFNASLTQDIGAAVRLQADQLLRDERFDEARAMIDSALAYDPSLDPSSRTFLEELRQRLPAE
ncbi:MAG: hypothetical protein AAGK78_12485, partial [Planctomycetota bacterium]